MVRYSTPSTAVTQKKGPRVAQTQAAGNRKIAQSLSPKGYPSRVGALCGCTAPRQNFHWSTFSFSESRTAFSFAVQKKKRFWPPLGKRKNNPQPGRQKSDFPRKGYAPSVRRLSQTTSATSSENHRPGGVNTNKQVTVFHPLNSSGAKGTTGRSNAGRRKQKDTPKSLTRGIP